MTARTHNLHLGEAGGRYWRERLTFRNHLREHPETAAEYARPKRRLATAHRDDREALRRCQVRVRLGGPSSRHRQALTLAPRLPGGPRPVLANLATMSATRGKIYADGRAPTRSGVSSITRRRAPLHEEARRDLVRGCRSCSPAMLAQAFAMGL